MMQFVLNNYNLFNSWVKIWIFVRYYQGTTFKKDGNQIFTHVNGLLWPLEILEIEFLQANMFLRFNLEQKNNSASVPEAGKFNLDSVSELK